MQKELHARVSAGGPDTVVLLEHEPVYTAGKRTHLSEHPTDGSVVVEVDRGGKITWHGPGQLVGYPILSLSSPLDVVRYVRSLEQFLLDLLADLKIIGYRVEGRSGVWVDYRSNQSKIAAIGVKVAGGVTMHGFSLNCSNSLEPYRRIIPCGIPDAGVTSISEILGEKINPIDVVDSLKKHFQRVVGAR